MFKICFNERFKVKEDYLEMIVVVCVISFIWKVYNMMNVGNSIIKCYCCIR